MGDGAYAFSKQVLSEPFVIADWLVENTSLTFAQIADFCDLMDLQVKSIADGIMPIPPLRIDPVATGLISIEEIMRCQRNAEARPEKRVEHLNEPPEPTQLLITRVPIDAPVHKVSLVRIFFLFYGRNAWHSTWIKRYYTNGSIRGTLPELKSFVESKRVQGSVFNIEELPALAFQSDVGTLLITEINKGNTFACLASKDCKNLTLSNVATWASDVPDNTVITLIVPGNVVFMPLKNDDRLRAWKSFPQGSTSMLDWSEQQSRPFQNSVFETLVEAAEDAIPVTIFKWAFASAVTGRVRPHLGMMSFFAETNHDGTIALQCQNGQGIMSLSVSPNWLAHALSASGVDLDDNGTKEVKV